MLKVEVILGVIASSLAILTFFVRALVNIRRGRRERKSGEESRRRGEITRGE
ncbi:MAG TPA: hypothetical protein VNI55_10000 [Gaiellaceae bacterium]|nr:hypothetical protein [Gaiellaceae bacterium]